ncbi:MAG: hypothetical protein KGL95_05530, partial [Patescibacteria group bacterium]|nr:hypothetical protein [Patescibacteria group bacterium]
MNVSLTLDKCPYSSLRYRQEYSVPKITSFNSSYEHHEQKSSNIFSAFFNWFSSLDKFYRFSFIIMLLIIIATPIITTQRFTLFNFASTNKTAVISVSPYTGTYNIGDTFTVNLIVDGGGQVFNAARATVTVSSNLTVQSLTAPDPASGGCGFVYPAPKSTPTPSNPSFAGAILNASSPRCIVYSMTLVANTTGTGTIALTQESVKAYSNSAEIFLSSQDGTYSLGITPTPTTNPTPTPTPIVPTPTPTIPPQVTPTPTPTTSPVQSPTINTMPTDTYQSGIVLIGTVPTGITTVYVNNVTTGVTYPSSTTWQYPVTLAMGTNTFTVYGVTANGVK